MIKFTVIKLLLVSLFTIGLTSAAHSQYGDLEGFKFKPGENSMSKSGEVKGFGEKLYFVELEKGQKLTLRITMNKSGITGNILKNLEPVSEPTNSEGFTEITAPESGVYLVQLISAAPKDGQIAKFQVKVEVSGSTRESFDDTPEEPVKDEVGNTSALSDSCGLNPTDTQVFLYEHINFEGKCVAIPKAGFNFPNMNNPILNRVGVVNDQISSIKVGKRVRAMVCQDDSYQNCQSLLTDWNDLRNAAVGNDTISSLKVLDKREIVEMTFYNRTDQPIVIFELVGGTNSFLGRIEPNGGGKIYSDLRTTIVAGINNKEVKGSKYQLMDASPKVFNFSLNGNKAVQMTSDK